MANLNDTIQRAIGLSNAPTDDTYAPMLAFMMGLARRGETVPPWWSRSRDKKLFDLWKGDGGHLSGFMNAAVTKISAIPFRIEARDPTIVSHVNQAEELTYMLTYASEFGQTLPVAMNGFAQDFLGYDNGGFLELIGDPLDKDLPISGPVLAVRAIDGSACTRTGDPLRPVYVQEAGKSYHLHYTRVIFMSQLPSTKQMMHKVGLCAVSRSIAIANDLKGTLEHKAQKRGERPIDRILVGDGISGAEILQSLVAGQMIMQELGMDDKGRTVAIGGDGVSLEKIDLNDLEDFDEEKAIVMGVYGMSLTWGLEPNETWPLTGSLSSDKVALQRSRSKLVQSYTHMFEAQASYKLVPRHLKAVLDFPDDDRDQQRAVIEDIRARNGERNLKSGRSTVYVERRRMLEDGQVDRSGFISMMLEDGMMEDGTPVAQLFVDERYSDLLLINRASLIPEAIGDIDAAQQIAANKMVVNSILATTASAAVSRRCRESLAALDWLEKERQKWRGLAGAQPAAAIGRPEQIESGNNLNNQGTTTENKPQNGQLE